jgi:hypothetical protein
LGGSTTTITASVVDNMVLAMFIDADRSVLLSDLAGGDLFVTPGILDPAEPPPYAQQPVAEFARGIFSFQGRIGTPVIATRLARRMAFHQARGTLWRPAELSVEELAIAHAFTMPAIWTDVQAANPTIRPRRIGRGEAECAAVAVARGWRLWSDDAAIVGLLTALHPGHPVERISDLLTRAVREGLVTCEAAADLYNRDFKAILNLWSRLEAACRDGILQFA